MWSPAKKLSHSYLSEGTSHPKAGVAALLLWWMLVSYHSCIFRGFPSFFTEILPWENMTCNVGLFSFGLNDKEEHAFPCPLVLTLAQFVTHQKQKWTVFCWVGGSGLGDRSHGTSVSPAEVAVGRRKERSGSVRPSQWWQAVPISSGPSLGSFVLRFIPSQ